MKDKLKKDASRHSEEKSKQKKAPKLEAAKGDDELMSQPPEPMPEPVSIPQIDPHVKLARRETAQETIHEVMTKHEAQKLTSKKSKE